MCHIMTSVILVVVGALGLTRKASDRLTEEIPIVKYFVFLKGIDAFKKYKIFYSRVQTTYY